MPHKPDPTLSRMRHGLQLAKVTVWSLQDLIACHDRARTLMRRIIGWSDRLQRSGKLRVMAADQIDLADVTIAIAQLTLELEEMERITRLALHGQYRHKADPRLVGEELAARPGGTGGPRAASDQKQSREPASPSGPQPTARGAWAPSGDPLGAAGAQPERSDPQRKTPTAPAMDVSPVHPKPKLSVDEDGKKKEPSAAKRSEGGPRKVR